MFVSYRLEIVSQKLDFRCAFECQKAERSEKAATAGGKETAGGGELWAGVVLSF